MIRITKFWCKKIYQGKKEKKIKLETENTETPTLPRELNTGKNATEPRQVLDKKILLYKNLFAFTCRAHTHSPAAHQLNTRYHTLPNLWYSGTSYEHFPTYYTLSFSSCVIMPT